MRKLPVLICCCLLVGGIAMGQDMSPKAGAESAGLYTNLYFAMNYKLPAGWEPSFVARDGECEQECMLLDARAPDKNTRRAVTVTAERVANGEARAPIAAATLERLGAKKLAPPKEMVITGHKAYRVDYRSRLGDVDVYYSVVTVTVAGRDYTLVFSFSSENRKHLDSLVEELPKGISFVGQS